MSGRPTDHNNFDDPRRVETVPLDVVDLPDGGMSVTLPACAIAALEIALR